jgi:hypothetical protein
VTVSYPTKISAALAGIRRTPHRARHHLPSLLCLVAALSQALSAASWESLRAETNPPPATNPIEGTNSQAVLHAYLKLQAQLQATQLAIEQNRQEAKEAALQSAEAISIALVTFQESFVAQQARHLEAMQRFNKLTLIMAGTFATIGFLAMLMMSYFQWRMSQGLARISAALPAALRLGPSPAVPALGPDQQLSLQLLAATAPPGKRIQEPERTSAPIPKSREVPTVSIEQRLFPTPGVSLRRRPVRALRIAIIIGLVCAGMLALLIYLVPEEIEYILERLVQGHPGLR